MFTFYCKICCMLHVVLFSCIYVFWDKLNKNITGLVVEAKQTIIASGRAQVVIAYRTAGVSQSFH